MKHLKLFAFSLLAALALGVRAEEPKADAKAEETKPETLVGELHKGPAQNAKGKAKKGNPDTIVIAVDNEGAKNAKAASRNARQVTLTAGPDVIAQLTVFAERNSHVKVTGVLTGDTMEVKEVSDAPFEGKKKKKNGV